jgi:GNAT superfamily N-acetyltransferase
MITARELRADEIKKIAPLMLLLYEKWDRIDPLDRIERDWFLTERQYAYLTEIFDDHNKVFFGAYCKEKLIGYLLAEVEERKPFLQTAGYIAETYTIPEYRGKGAGSAMVKKAFEWFRARKLEWIMVGAHSMDAAAVSFWQNRGFTEFNKILKQKKGQQKD